MELEGYWLLLGRWWWKGAQGPFWDTGYGLFTDVQAHHSGWYMHLKIIAKSTQMVKAHTSKQFWVIQLCSVQMAASRVVQHYSSAWKLVVPESNSVHLRLTPRRNLLLSPMAWHHLWGIFHMQKQNCPHLLRVLHRASHTVESLRHGFPVFSHFHHGTCIKDPIAKEVIKFQANTIPSPLMDLIMKLVPFGGEHGQMLHISPGQTQAGYQSQRECKNKGKGEGERGGKRERDTWLR